MSQEESNERLNELKLKAKRLGIKHHHKIGVDKLTKLIQAYMAALDDNDDNDDNEEEDLELPEDTTGVFDPQKGKFIYRESKSQRRARIVKEMNKLIRVRVTCMNPNKKEWFGEVITGSNSLATFKKYVPFNAPGGWHVPQIIFNIMQERQMQVFYTVTTKQGAKIKRSRLVPEFSIDVLPPITTDALKELHRTIALTEDVE